MSSCLKILTWPIHKPNIWNLLLMSCLPFLREWKNLCHRPWINTVHKKYTFSFCRKLNCHFQRSHQTCFIRLTSLFWDSMDLQTGRERLVSNTNKKLIFITKLNATHNHYLNHILLRQKSIILRQEKQACWVLTQRETIQHSHKEILSPNSWRYLTKLVCYHCLGCLGILKWTAGYPSTH